MIEGTFLALFFAAAVVITRRIAARLVTDRLYELSDLFERPGEPVSELSAALEPIVRGYKQPDEIQRFAAATDALFARLRELVESLEGRDQQRREWLSRISHDLRTPLTALNACLARARTTAEGMLDAGEREIILDALRVAHLDADRFQALASDLLDVARLEGRDVQVLREPVPPGELLRSVAVSLKFIAEDHEVALTVDTPTALPELNADGHRLARALENLIRNALQHAHSEVCVQARRAGDSVEFVISDDGPGLPADEGGHVDLEHLAETPSRPDSSGIGLLVARRVVALHGGSIGGENPEGGGARLWFRIPRTLPAYSTDPSEADDPDALENR